MSDQAVSAKESSCYESYQQDAKNDGKKEEQDEPNSLRNILLKQKSKDSHLPTPAFEQSHFPSDKNGPRPRCVLPGQDPSSRREDTDIHDFSGSHDELTFLSDDGNCETAVDIPHTDGEQEHERKKHSKCKIDEPNTKSVNARLLTEEEKVRERSRKGRERSLRTRRRNVARLKLLEANCAHFSEENRILRDLARNLGEEDTEGALESFKQYKLLKEKKPELHRLSQSESYYMDLLSPLSVTASTATGETDCNGLDTTEDLLKTEHSVIPCTYKGVPTKHKSEDSKPCHTQHDVKASAIQKSLRVTDKVSRATEKAVSSVDDFHSVFADPDYCDDRNIGIAIEDLYKQPPLSVEEIFDLLEEGRRNVERSRL